MSAGRIVRRTFLVGSAAVAGGVAFGVYLAKRPLPNPLLDGLDEGEAAITPFVKITPEGITLITPRADLGQGIYSMQAYLIAEELDVDPAKCTLDPGRPHAAYHNRAMADAAAPFPEHAQTWSAEATRDIVRVLLKTLGMQVTGGSTSVPDMYQVLREAGATARETMKRAASEATGVPVAKLRTEDGAVILPDGTRRPYTELAADAARVAPVTDVALRDPSEWRYLGQAIVRTDIVAKSTGTQTYGIDLAMDGMLHATVRANPGLGADAKRYDGSKVESMRGVKKVVKIRHGVGVIADNTWRAFKAADALDIEWEPGPFPASTEAMWEQLSAAHAPEYQNTRNRDDGDVEAALAEGEILEAEYRTPYMAHAPMEPMNAVARYTPDRLDIWTGTQIPAFLRDHAAELTGLDPSQVHVHAQWIGGSFGRRLEDTYALQAVELAMAMPGTPIKMTWTREEDMTHHYPRPMHMARFRGKVKGGKVEALDMSSIAQSIMASWFGRLMGAPPGPDAILVAGAWDQPLAIPHFRVTGYAAPEMVPVSSWRAPGANSNGFFLDGFLDELIHAAGADPLEERIRLASWAPARAVLEAVGEMSGWSGPKLGENRGRGVAFVYSHGVPTAEVVDVTMTDRGIRIDKVYVAADVGRVLDPINVEAQLSGGAIFGLGHAMNCQLTYEDHTPQQTNFDSYEGMRLYQTPEIVTRALENQPKIHGIGEPAVPPAAPALANAIFAATGKRIREMPFDRHVDFV